MHPQPVVLVTGASRGIGQTVATTLAARGYRVFGTSRAPSASSGDTVTMLPLDITSAASVAACVAGIDAQAGRIDALVNNVGSLLWGAAEETSPAELEAQLEVNFRGAVRLMLSVIPLMRAQGSGNIINMSSIGGLLAMPYSSAYAASKHALEGYSEALRYELLPDGIFVSLVEPGGVRTESLEDSNPRVAESNPVHLDTRERIRRQLIDQSLRRGVSPGVVANTIAKIIADPTPRLRYPVGTQAKILPLLQSLLPESLFLWLVRQQFALASAPRSARRHAPTPRADRT